MAAVLQDDKESTQGDGCIAASTLPGDVGLREPIQNYSEHGLPPLNYKPFLLRSWVLSCAALLNVGWIIWLAIAYSKPRWQGPDFFLDGLFAGYVATIAKTLLNKQVLNIGKIMPYRNMRNFTGRNVRNTIDSDYWPYEWPIPRLRAIRNGDYFFQFVDVIFFLSTSAVVQFESNIFTAQYDENDDFLGYDPNPGVIIIAIVCHVAIVGTTLAILVWLQLKETGLLAEPGYLSLYLSIFDKDDVQEDFQGLEDEDRRWIVRQHLSQNEYRLGYWTKGQRIVYGIRRNKIANTIPPRAHLKRRSPTEYPEFRYVPWFLTNIWVCTWTSFLAAGFAIMATLVIKDDVINSGFAPYLSTTKTPFVAISAAQFLWSFFPSFAADMFLSLVQSIDTFYRLVQPYADLKRKNTAPNSIINCFRINYTNDLPLVVTIRAFNNRHFKVGFISIFALFACLTPAWAANMFYVSNDRMSVWTTYFYPVLMYMSFLILFLLWAIPDRSRYMPRDLETVADHMALFSQSSLLQNEEFQYEAPRSSVLKSEKVPSDSENPKSGGIKISNSASQFTKSIEDFFKSIHFELRQVKEKGWKTVLMEIKQNLIGPPELVVSVTKVMTAVAESNQQRQENDQDKELPRFGIWQGVESFVVGIDNNTDSKMFSLFEKEFYSWNLGEVLHSWVEQLF